MKFDKSYKRLLEKTLNKCFVFDFDQTLAETGAMVVVTGNDEKRLNTKEFNNYVLQDGESFDFTEFDDGDRILNKSILLPYFYVMKDIYKKNYDIYILTARSAIISDSLHSLLERHNIHIPMENIFAIGDPLNKQTVAERKKQILHKLSNDYDDVTFFDDDERNIELAKSIGTNVKTKHIKLNERKLEEISYKKLLPIGKGLDYVSNLFKKKVVDTIKDHDKIANCNLNKLLSNLNVHPAINEFKNLLDKIDLNLAKEYFHVDVETDSEARKLFIDKINDKIEKFNNHHLPFSEVVLAYKELEKILTLLRNNKTEVVQNQQLAKTVVYKDNQDMSTVYDKNSSLVANSIKRAKILLGILNSSKSQWSDKFMAICILVFGLQIEFN